MVSVLMATYNESINDLKLSIDSILNQTYSKLEFIIVLDNPQNFHLKEFLVQQAQMDKRIKLLFNDKNIGLAQSLNKAFRESSGKYIARMDADDISELSRFEKQVDFLNLNKSYHIVASDRINIDEQSNIINTRHIVVNDSRVFKKAMEYDNLVTHPSVMMRREVLEQLNGYRDFRAAQDYDLWLRAIKKEFKIYTLPQVLIKYRIRNNSISNINVAKQHGCMMYAYYLFKNEKEDKPICEDNYVRFLKRHKMYFEKDKNSYNKAYKILFSNNKSKNIFVKTFRFIKATLIHHQIIKNYFNSKIKDFLTKRYTSYTEV